MKVYSASTWKSELGFSVIIAYVHRTLSIISIVASFYKHLIVQIVSLSV